MRQTKWGLRKMWCQRCKPVERGVDLYQQWIYRIESDYRGSQSSGCKCIWSGTWTGLRIQIAWMYQICYGVIGRNRNQILQIKKQEEIVMLQRMTLLSAAKYVKPMERWSSAHVPLLKENVEENVLWFLKTICTGKAWSVYSGRNCTKSRS